MSQTSTEAQTTPATEQALEQRLIISCTTCNNLTVATAWPSKLEDTITQLNQGRHQEHEFQTETEEQFYSRGESNPLTKGDRKFYREKVAENNGIYFFTNAPS